MLQLTVTGYCQSCPGLAYLVNAVEACWLLLLTMTMDGCTV